MNQFQVAPEIFEKMPNVCFGVVVIRGIDNQKSYPAIADFYQKTQKKLFDKLAGRKAKEYPAIIPYR